MPKETKRQMEKKADWDKRSKIKTSTGTKNEKKVINIDWKKRRMKKTSTETKRQKVKNVDWKKH